MKKIFLSLLVIALAVTVNAQEGKRGGHGRKGGEHGIMKDINLTEEQKTKMKTINQDFRKQMVELRKNENITVKDQRDRIARLRNDHKAKIQSVLTAEQKSQIEKAKADRKANAETKMKSRADKMKTELGLTNDQAAQLEKLRADTRSKIEALRSNTSLDESAKRTQMKQIHEEQKTKMQSILTAEQKEKMKSMRHKGGKRNKGQKI